MGQQINLTNMISGVPTNAITSYQWTIPGANNQTNDTAFYDYEPAATNSNYTNLFTPTNYTTNSYCNFYWSSGGTNVVTCTEVIYGQTNTVSAVFNVQRPYAWISATTGTISADTNYDGDGKPYLHFGSLGLGLVPGITFSQTNSVPSPFTGSFEWNQIVNTNNLTWITTSSTNGYQTYTSSTHHYGSFGYDSSPPGSFPYTANASADDSPATPLGTNETSDSRDMTATMYLMWKPNTNSVNGDKTVLVPLRSYQWWWGGVATNTSPTNNGSGWTSPSQSYPSSSLINVDETNERTWSFEEYNNRNPY